MGDACYENSTYGGLPKTDTVNDPRLVLVDAERGRHTALCCRPIESVAKITGRTTGAVKSLQHRALQNLQHTLSPTASSGHGSVR